jgi:hypothetical protein
LRVASAEEWPAVDVSPAGVPSEDSGASSPSDPAANEVAASPVEWVSDRSPSKPVPLVLIAAPVAGALLAAIVLLIVSFRPVDESSPRVSRQIENLGVAQDDRSRSASTSGGDERSAQPPGPRVPPSVRPSRVSYDPASRRLQLSVRREPLYRVLMQIAWQTGLRIETEIGLEEIVSIERSDAPLGLVLRELLGGYRVLELSASEPDGVDPRTIWILSERSGSESVDRAVDLLLESADQEVLEGAARILEEAGRIGTGYGLLDLIDRADTLDPEESHYLSDVHERIRKSFCTAWVGAAVGPQAAGLRCD